MNLKDESISQKLTYIRGVLKELPIDIESNKISISWANSYDLRDLFASSLYDVLTDKYYNNTIFEKNKSRPKFTIEKREFLGWYPGVPRVELVADEEVIDYIRGKIL